tara:strand:- start:3315 stop:4265 length:951 start_codon:yes stop_codon:yes gene_type:complete
MNEKVGVSVCIVSFNQEKYIRKCLQSVIDQKTNFNFEIVIGDDASSDRTLAVVEEFRREFPELIKVIAHDRNVGWVNNMRSVYDAAKGKYICHLDGDDYAFPGKLQIQFDLLESNKDCVICSHDMTVIDDDDVVIRESFKRHRDGVNSLKDLLASLPFFAHSSKMFRNEISAGFWESLGSKSIDIEFHVNQLKVSGLIYHIDQPFGAYRTSVGVSSKLNQVNPVLEGAVDKVFRSLLMEGAISNDFLLKCYAKSKFRYAYQSAVFGDKAGMIRLIKESVEISRFSKAQLAFFYCSKAPSFLVFLCKFRARARGYKV